MRKKYLKKLHYWSSILLKNRIEVLVLLLVFIGGYIRVWNLWEYFWSADDIIRITISSADSVGDFLLRNSIDTHPPLIYLLLGVLLGISTNDMFLRLISLVPGILIIPVSYLLGKEMFGSKVGITFSIFSTFGHGLVLLSQPLRQYMLALVLLEVSLFYLIKFYKEQTTKYLSFHLLFGFLSITSHYLMLITLGAFQLAYLLPLLKKFISDRKLLSRILAFVLSTLIFILVSYLYQGNTQWGATSIHQQAAYHEWLSYGYPKSVLEYVLSFVLIISYFSIPTYNIEQIYPLMLFFFTFLLGLVYLIRGTERNLGYVFIVVISVSVILTINTLYPFSGTRHSVHLYIPIMLICSLGIVKFIEVIYKRLFARLEIVYGITILLVVLLNTIFALQNNFYRRGISAIMELPILRSEINNYINFLNENVNINDIVISDRQTGLYLGYLSGGLSTGDFTNQYGRTQINNTPVYFSNQWGFAHVLSEYRSSYDHGLLEENYTPTRVWFITIGWRNSHIDKLANDLHTDSIVIKYADDSRNEYIGANAIVISSDKLNTVWDYSDE